MLLINSKIIVLYLSVSKSNIICKHYLAGLVSLLQLSADWQVLQFIKVNWKLNWLPEIAKQRTFLTFFITLKKIVPFKI